MNNSEVSFSPDNSPSFNSMAQDTHWMVNANGVQTRNQDAGNTPIFTTEYIHNKAKSEAEGRPVFDTQEIVKILIAGDPLNVASHPVTGDIIDRFPEAYARFKRQDESIHVSGTPIDQWPALSKLQVMEMKALNILSVEALIAVSDSNINRITDGRLVREKAKAFLEYAKDTAAASKYAAENMQLREDIADLRRQLSDMSAQIENGGVNAAPVPNVEINEVKGQMAEMQRMMAEMRAMQTASVFPGAASNEQPIETVVKRGPGRPAKDAA